MKTYLNEKTNFIKKVFKNYKKPVKNLTISFSKNFGKSNGKNLVYGKIKYFKYRYRFIDFFRFFLDLPFLVKNIEYDPNRNCFIFLICYENGILSYNLASDNVYIGDFLISSRNKNIPLKSGNTTVLKNIPNGFFINSLEIYPYSGSKFSRSSGSFSVILKKLGNFFSLIKLKSGEFRIFNSLCLATIGSILDFNTKNIYKLNIYKKHNKASRSLFLRKKFTVRGVAKNPVDHPHGGGEGKTSGSNVPVSYSGKISKGGRTRNFKNNFLIIKPRYLSKFKISNYFL